MKHLIMGTAGHVDHGKTLLVKALTGIDCDTHPEEKARGITINPGYANLDLNDPDCKANTKDVPFQQVGIVDVPGHQRFIHNMLAGACGIDFVLLVVAADDGVMPQTREHVAILEHLGIQDGLVALTKIDLVDTELAEMAKDEIGKLLQNTFLKQAAIVPVSSRTGAGLEQLKNEIRQVVLRLPARSTNGVFRVYLDRVFSVEGCGTVVTGSVLAGTAKSGDHLCVLPKGLEVRIKRIENHGKEVHTVVAGDRASFNLSDFKCADFKRGMVLSDRPIPAVSVIDAVVTLTDPHSTLKVYSKALFYTGTQETMCRLHLLDKDTARCGDKVLVQLAMEKPVVLLNNDSFILRRCSADATLGGGRVIDVDPLHHRRRPPSLVKQIKQRAEGNLQDQVQAELKKQLSFVMVADLAQKLNTPANLILQTVSDQDAGNVWLLKNHHGEALLGPEARERLWNSVQKTLTTYHAEHPLTNRGLDTTALAMSCRGESTHQQRDLFEVILKKWAFEKRIKPTPQNGWQLFAFEAKPTTGQTQALNHIRQRFANTGMTVINPEDLQAEVYKNFKLGHRDFQILIKHLTTMGEVVCLEEVFLEQRLVDSCRRKLLNHLVQNPQGITVAQFRDLVAGNRRICLILIGLYDREGITRREGDLRFLTNLGQKRFQSLQQAAL